LRRASPDLVPPAFSAGLSSCGALARHRRTISSSTWAQSPMIGISTFTFLLIEEASISTWMRLEKGEKASSRPVMRSSKRAPMLIITSHSCIARFAS
jgi:hypothetical protein